MRPLEDLKSEIAKIKHQNSPKQILKSKVPTSFKVCAEIFSGIITGLIVGSILDHIFKTKAVFTVISLILGCIASFRVLYHLMVKK